MILGLHSAQVKICGLTRVDEAVACAEAGAAAIGCVFFPPSPRHVTEHQARSIFQALPERVCSVGVFVNEDYEAVMRKVERTRLKAVQLHGQESPGLVKRLRREGVTVIKALFANGAPPLASVGTYEASAYLVECAGGRLPGGNAMTWDWVAALEVSRAYPVVLAGGLDPQNVVSAMEAAGPDAVDVSSAVESTPGRKDIEKVLRFLEAVRGSRPSRELKRIFP
jgi:phosphoribosylanthranilate isomerase